MPNPPLHRMRSNRIGELSVKPLVNTSSRCLFVLAVALAATAPSYSQGYILPDGVTCSSAGLSVVVHVMQSPINGDYTGVILRSRFFTPGSPYYTIFSFEPGAPMKESAPSSRRRTIPSAWSRSRRALTLSWFWGTTMASIQVFPFTWGSTRAIPMTLRQEPIAILCSAGGSSLIIRV